MAEVTATPNPIAAGTTYTLAACGLEMKPVEVFMDDRFVYAIGVKSTPDGLCLDGNYTDAPDSPGSYLLELKQTRDHGKKKDIVGTVTLVVE